MAYGITSWCTWIAHIMFGTILPLPDAFLMGEFPVSHANFPEGKWTTKSTNNETAKPWGNLNPDVATSSWPLGPRPMDMRVAATSPALKVPWWTLKPPMDNVWWDAKDICFTMFCLHKNWVVCMMLFFWQVISTYAYCEFNSVCFHMFV